ncbi:hypothetical protein HaLaN_01873, partial [Haematococcus lacustris]
MSPKALSLLLLLACVSLASAAHGSVHDATLGSHAGGAASAAVRATLDMVHSASRRVQQLFHDGHQAAGWTGAQGPASTGPAKLWVEAAEQVAAAEQAMSKLQASLAGSTPGWVATYPEIAAAEQLLLEAQ